MRREAAAGWRPLALFWVCVVAAVVAVAGVGGWRQAIETGMARDSQQTLGGDILVLSKQPFSAPLLRAIQAYHPVLTQETFTVAVAPPSGKTLFVKLKSVEAGYPLYGQVPLASGRDLHQALKTGVVVESKVLQRLHLQVGDSLKIGRRTFAIADVALREPDRPLGFFGISPRIFLSAPAWESTGLMTRTGSYLERRLHVRLKQPEQADGVAELLRHSARPDQEEVETWRQPPRSIRRFVKNFFRFLDLVAVFAVALGGLGMQGSLRVWLRGRRPILATLRTLGATPTWTTRQYACLVAAVSLLGIACGLALAAGGLHLSGDWLVTLLPGQDRPFLGLAPALEAAALGGLASAAFTLLPLAQLAQVRPAALVEAPPRAGRATPLLLLLTTFTLLSLMTGEWQRSALASLGLALLVGLVWALGGALLGGLRRWRPAHLELRTGLRGLLSVRSQTRSIVTVLASTLTVLFTLTLSQASLHKAWVEALPPAASNLIFFDIQPDQVDGFVHLFGRPIEVYPSLRVRFQAVDGRPISRTGLRDEDEQDARREFRGSSLPELDAAERLVGAADLFRADGPPQQVSVLDTVARTAGLQVGSRLTLTLQGVPTEVTVSSLRHVIRESFRPTFHLLFPASMVAQAPRTIFATARVPEADIGDLQSKIAGAYPGITSMDLSDTLRRVAQKLDQLLTLTRLLLLLGMVPGVVILVSSALATRLERQRESAYFKVLGANGRFVSRVVLWENLALGLICSSVALLLALLTTGGLCSWVWEVPLQASGGIAMAMLLLPTVLIASLGWLLSIPVIRSRPAPFLRPDA